MTRDPDIEPDTKNWTWVLERPCPECGFDAAAVDATSAGTLVRRLGAAWADCLAEPDASVREVSSKWSVLEYGCHIRDVFELYDWRLELMLTEDDPQFPNWDQDETAVEKDYGSQDPAVVAGEVLACATRLADRFDTVHGEQWARTGVRSDGVAFTIASFATYLVHDPVHHLRDVGAAW